MAHTPDRSSADTAASKSPSPNMAAHKSVRKPAIRMTNSPTRTPSRPKNTLPLSNTHVQARPGFTPKTCRNCSRTFNVSLPQRPNSCSYHPGSKVYKAMSDTGRSITKWTCCDKDMQDPGCTRGTHVALTISPGAKRPSEGDIIPLSSSIRSQKNPRLW